MSIGRSYTIPCASAFRDRVLRLAGQRQVSVADLLRAVHLLVPAETLARVADPGEPAPPDREEVVLQSGPAKNRRIRRKPRLQARLQGVHAAADLRRALRLALDLAEGSVALRVEAAGSPDLAAEQADDLDRMRQIVQALAFQPLAEDIRSRSEALYVLGFPPGALPDQKEMRARFRALATIYHPDNATGDTLRMAQLNAAIAFLTQG
jgi:hypothetical protein